ncbi:MAG: AMP-binding protein, partial [Deltaproteobacteria bacterium]
MNVGDILRFFANRHPEKTAVHYLDRTVTYKELNNRVNRLANRYLSLGYRPNDKISILLQNCIEYLEIVFALAKIGAISVPINFRLVDEEIKYIVNDSDSKALILEKEFIENVASVKSQLVVETDKYYVTGNDVADGFLSYEALFKG